MHVRERQNGGASEVAQGRALGTNFNDLGGGSLEYHETDVKLTGGHH